MGYVGWAAGNFYTGYVLGENPTLRIGSLDVALERLLRIGILLGKLGDGWC